MSKIRGLHAKIIKEQFQTALEKKGYVFFGSKSRSPWNVNIIGVRSDEDRFNKFDDAMVVIYRDNKGEWEVQTFRITTDPGRIWLEKPMNSKGCAILVPDQYRGVYKIDGHGTTRYEALCQRAGEVSVYRDADLDHEHDRDAGTITTGNYGINIHRSRKYGEVELVENYSAGCQVFKNTTDFNEFMKLINKSAKKYGNSFTYTLINEGDIAS